MNCARSHHAAVSVHSKFDRTASVAGIAGILLWISR